MGSLLIDEREGVSYPDGTQTSDGAIYIIYDYDRLGAKEILLTRFTEDDVIRGKYISKLASPPILVNKAKGDNPLKK